MSALAVESFGFEGNAVRTVDRKGQPWLVAQDVCSILQIKNVSQAVQNLEADEKDVCLTYSPGASQEMIIISEAGYYTLALRCRAAMKPGTRPYRFRKWVTGELLPCLRGTGRYVMAANDPCNIPGPLGDLHSQDGRDRAKVLLVAIREARCIFGANAAGALWVKLGFPPPEYVALPKGWKPNEQLMIAPTSDVVLWKQCRLVETDPDAEPVAAAALFNDYRAWCADQQREPLDHSTFGKMLSSLGVPVTYNKAGAWRRGFTLID